MLEYTGARGGFCWWLTGQVGCEAANEDGRIRAGVFTITLPNKVPP